VSNEIVAELIRNLAAIIGAFASVITALGVLLVGFWAYKSKTQSETNAAILNAVRVQGKSHATTLEAVSTNVNGMSSSLVAATKAAASAQGQLIGRDEERAYVESSNAPSPLAVEVPIRVQVVKPDIETEK
jgi:hypothetical protein